MGTRHQQKVIAPNGELRVSQYGQWDGYPSGQGVDILNFLRTSNLDEYAQNVAKLEQATVEQLEDVEKGKNPYKEYPYLYRECGAKIHKMILDNEVKFVSFIDDEEAKKWCEGFYTIDLQNHTFTSEYDDKIVTYSLALLPTVEEYLKVFESEESEDNY